MEIVKVLEAAAMAECQLEAAKMDHLRVEEEEEEAPLQFFTATIITIAIATICLAIRLLIL